MATPPFLSYARAMLGMHLAALRRAWRDGDRGASAVELAIITAMILGIALALLIVIKKFVLKESGQIHG
jgi:Flp pilus assembly pilin Flp